MLTYEYECTKCGKHFELQQKMSDPPRKRCPDCRWKWLRHPRRLHNQPLSIARSKGRTVTVR
ncbi:MAG: zinc ribbon domain-containing protein [Candidatus Krumholzibacteria bacterium]|nr:zinc ribbon domain-containing protein [Candidatus Krumholzibacteria bacterium]